MLGASAATCKVPTDLYQGAERSLVLKAARELIDADNLGTFITVDGSGMPRARAVFLAPPDDDFTSWIGTRRGSRKLDQIAVHPAATLHLEVDQAASYLSLMGTAERIADPVLRQTKSAYRDMALRKQFFPNFPHDFELIRFQPKWLEVYNLRLPGKRTTWQPEAVVLT